MGGDLQERGEVVLSGRKIFLRICYAGLVVFYTFAEVDFVEQLYL